jgi:hypothetical protein
MGFRMKKTSVILLNWNGRKLLEQFLPLVLQHSLSDDCDVWVADNCSSDGSVAFLHEQFPDVPVMVFDKNYGFAEGYNRALQQVDSHYVVLLNSDVETTPGWLKTLTNYMDKHPEVAAVQPKIRSYTNRLQFEYAGASGGFIDRFAYPFCRGRILETVEEDSGQYDDPIPVFWATGAALCIRREAYLEAGGLDAGFFAHMEEIDLCWRLNARGHSIVCVPSSVVYHVGGASLNKDNPKKMYLNFRNNLLMIYKNVYGRRFLFTIMVRYLFDLLAYLHLLVQGQFSNGCAVINAHRDFLKLLPSYKHARRENRERTTVKHIPTHYKGSILWNYYFRGKKTFGEIKW